jgi:acetyltransferase-like isoleucine patch superfamily enzyme
MSGVKVGEHGLLGSMGVATKDVPPYHIMAGVPAKTVKVKPIAPDAIRRAAETK